VKLSVLGKTGLTVSRIGLGTANLGWMAPAEASHALLDRALDQGINLIDTADTYGGRPNEGYCETIIGDWLAQDPARRRRIVLATKLYYGDTQGAPNVMGLSAYRIRQACEDSLRRLRTDHIDLYQMHRADRTVRWEEVWQAMESLVQQGKVVYVGSSNFAGWQIAQASTVASARHLVGLASEQSIYNLAKRQVELEVIPACEALGIGFLPWSPLGGGVLCGGTVAGASGRRSDDRVKKARAADAERLRAYEALCGQIGAQPADVALAWVMSRKGVTSVLIGPRTVAQLDGSLRAAELALGADVLAKLDAIWPGPGGPAPDAYAF
jgi:aryl-alcohol dehydrogenase-like predicted oxidoreductase